MAWEQVGLKQFLRSLEETESIAGFARRRVRLSLGKFSRLRNGGHQGEAADNAIKKRTLLE